MGNDDTSPSPKKNKLYLISVRTTGESPTRTVVSFFRLNRSRAHHLVRKNGSVVSKASCRRIERIIESNQIEVFVGVSGVSIDVHV